MSSVGQGVGLLVGGIAGYFVPGVGFALGASIGGAIGGYLDPPKQKGNRPQTDLSVQTATYGAPIGTGYGNYAKYGNVFWVDGNSLRMESGSSGGKGGGKKATPDEIYGTFAIGFGEGEISAFGRIWCNGKLVYDPTAGTLGAKMANGDVAGSMAFYLGSATQLPDPRIQADMGAANTPGYRGLHYIVFYDWPMADYGNTLMGLQVKAEIINSATVTQYVRHVFSEEQIPDTSTFPGASPYEYGYFNPRIVDGVFMCDKASVANSYAYAYSISFEGNRLASSGASYETGVFGYIGQCQAGAITYVGFGTGTFKVGGSDWKLKTADSNNTCHGMAVGGDGRVYALERVAGAWLINTYDGADLSLISSATNYIIRYGDPHASIPCIPGTNVSFCVEPDGVHVWSAQEGGGTWNFVVGQISGGSLTALHWYTDGYLGAFGRFAAICAANGICYGVNNHGDYFAYDRIETLSKTHVTLASIIQKRCLMSGLLSAGDIDTSEITQTVRGYKVDGVGAIRNSLEPLHGAWPFDVVPSGYKLKFMPRGGASVATIDICDLGAIAGSEKVGDVLTQSREMDAQLPAKVQVTYIDANREYDKGAGPGAIRTSTDAVNVQAFDMPIVLTADEAAGIEETLLYLYWMERAEFHFTLPPTWLALEVSDVITVSDVGASYEMRLTEINYLQDGRLECSAKPNNPAIYTWTAKGQEGQVTGQVLNYAGPSLLQLLDIPCVDSSYMDKPGILSAVTGVSSSWPGGRLFKSGDSGQTWVGVHDYRAPGAVIGQASNAIGSGMTHIKDESNKLNLRAVRGTLSSVSESALFSGANHFAYGAAGRWEIIAAQTVFEESDGTFTLSGLMRGRFGTEQHMTSHMINDYVVFLDGSQVRFIGLGVSDFGLLTKWRAVTLGRSVDTAAETEYAYSGVNLKPLSPVRPGGGINPFTLDWSLTWIRRTRTPVEPFSGVPTPIGETSEAYEVEIWDSSYSTLKRIINVAGAQSCVYSSANQVADFGTNQSTIYMRVFQLSTTIGRGYPLQASVNVAVIEDPLISSLVVGLHMDDAALSDVKGHATTLNGNTNRSATQSRFGGYSAYFDGTGDYLSVTGETIGTGDFTIDGWVWITTPASSFIIFESRNSDESNANGVVFYVHTSSKLSVGRGAPFVRTSGPTSVSGGAWHYVELCRSSGTIRGFLDGQMEFSIANSDNLSLNGWRFGHQWNAAGTVSSGYIDDMRVTKAARRTSDLSYSPPASPFLNP